MCNPTALAVTGILAGGALSAKAQGDQASADAATLATQAEFERMKAKDAIARGQVNESRTRMAGSQEISQARADAAGSEVDLSSGTAASVFSAQRAVSELDALMVRSNAAREAWGHETQAQLYDQAARAKRKQGELGALGSFLGTAAGLGQLSLMKGAK